ncbi:hypothetical protein [Streptomyces monashensis]|uniref:Uncharacterized protein n=1 Tax=Streptomyces monashensis TaxID=1678012 RepID=A0A1S2QNV4_9ACTN|nr:hypothetical protein [Streptomyces monashensis]OIK07829.1 hypothetical protein BIV23_02360 [Streptomyces monashensis]
MERHLLMQLLADDNDDVSAADLAALRGGATHFVWDWTVPAEQSAWGYATRLRYLRRKDIEARGLDRAAQLLGRHDQPVRYGQITAADRTWVFTLFLTENGGALVACAGVRQAGE